VALAAAPAAAYITYPPITLQKVCEVPSEDNPRTGACKNGYRKVIVARGGLLNRGVSERRAPGLICNSRQC